jgi:hypothetical protein
MGLALTCLFTPALNIRISGAITPHPNTPSWCGAQLKKNTGTNVPLKRMKIEVNYFNKSKGKVVLVLN